MQSKVYVSRRLKLTKVQQAKSEPFSSDSNELFAIKIFKKECLKSLGISEY